MKLDESMETNLFNELSDQEQEVVAGGEVTDYNAFFNSLSQYGFTGPDVSNPGVGAQALLKQLTPLLGPQLSSLVGSVLKLN